jgi:putative transposase
MTGSSVPELGDRLKHVCVSGGVRSTRVIEVFARLVSGRGAPIHLRPDNGPEFVSRAILKWMVDEGIETALIDPGKP